MSSNLSSDSVSPSANVTAPVGMPPIAPIFILPDEDEPVNLYPDQIPLDASRMIGLLATERIINRFRDAKNIVDIEECLLLLRRFMLGINGQSLGAGAIENKTVNGKCPYLGTIPNSVTGCKVSDQIGKKAGISNFLTNIIIYLFKSVAYNNPELLQDTNPFIDSLSNTIEFFCHFIGSKHIGPIYADYVMPLADGLNGIFNPILGSDLILNRCYPTDRGYGCARAITTLKRDSKDLSDSDSKRIVLFSTDDDGTGELVTPPGLTIPGGSRRHRRRTHKRTHKKRRGLRSTRRR